MPEDLKENFQTTGLTHLVAISGSNVTMLLTALSVMLCWLPLKKRFLPSVFLIASFALFTGASASVVRAAIMGGDDADVDVKDMQAKLGQLALENDFLAKALGRMDGLSVRR